MAHVRGFHLCHTMTCETYFDFTRYISKQIPLDLVKYHSYYTKDSTYFPSGF